MIIPALVLPRQFGVFQYRRESINYISDFEYRQVGEA